MARNPVLRGTLVLCLLVVGLPVGASPTGRGLDPPGRDDASASIGKARAKLVRLLVDRGTSQVEATMVVKVLTDDDVRVLVKNPRMLIPAEANSTLIAWAIFLAVIGVGVGLIVAASA